MHDGRRHALALNHGLWRMRSQAKGRIVDLTLGKQATQDTAAPATYVVRRDRPEDGFQT